MEFAGKYVGTVSTIFLKGEVNFTILQFGEQFSLELKLPKPMDKVGVHINEIHRENNSLCGTGTLSIMPKSVVESKITFEESGKIKAFMKIPKLGKVVMKGIKKISD
ncbi:MAG: hypothetical protein NC110_02120 [Ruminococcus sp.]|nr:hypothetical protein [Ruminococcus sp.]